MTPDALQRLAALGRTPSDRALLGRALRELDGRDRLASKIAAEPTLGAIMAEFVGRLIDAFGPLSTIRGQTVLDIACGSDSSRSPATGRPTAAFEPWMCRLLGELGARPVGIDIGDLADEAFVHHRVDLGVPGSLDFLATGSFDAVHESRLSVHPSSVPRTGEPPSVSAARSIARNGGSCGRAGSSSTATVAPDKRDTGELGDCPSAGRVA